MCTSLAKGQPEVLPRAASPRHDFEAPVAGTIVILQLEQEETTRA